MNNEFLMLLPNAIGTVQYFNMNKSSNISTIKEIKAELKELENKSKN